MKKQIILTLAALSLLTTACGRDASFKTTAALKANDVAPATPADPTVESKAESIVAEDVNVNASKATDLSAILAEEIRGVSLTISTTTGEKDDGRPVSITSAKLTVASLKNNDCPVEEKSVKSFKLSDAVNGFINISEGGRFRCLEDACENILLIMESGRNVRVVAENGKKKSEYQFGNISVLLKKSTDGVYKPVSTESTAFAQIQDAKMGELNCIDELSSKAYDSAQKEVQGQEEKLVVTTPADGSTLSISDRVRAYQAALIAKDKATKDAVAKGQIPAETLNSNTKAELSISDRVRAYQAALIAKDKATKDAVAKGQIPAQTLNAQAGKSGTSTHQVIVPIAE
jgi:hypothetical protein